MPLEEVLRNFRVLYTREKLRERENCIKGGCEEMQRPYHKEELAFEKLQLLLLDEKIERLSYFIFYE